MGGSECGDVVANASQTVASPYVTAFGGGSVMVWGGICGVNRTKLVVLNGNLNGARYRDEILRPVVVPFLQPRGPDAIFQHDNATSHTCHVSRTFLQQQNVHVLDWPVKSPDLSHIEHVWDVLGRRVRRRRNQPTNLQELAQALTEEWDSIPANVIQRYNGSMRRRCNAVIQAIGGHTLLDMKLTLRTPQVLID